MAEARGPRSGNAAGRGAHVGVAQQMLGHHGGPDPDRYDYLFGDDLDTVADRLDLARADMVVTRRQRDADAIASAGT